MAQVRFEHGFDGPANMARDFALLDEVREGPWAARVYTWSEPWVTLGKFQDPETDLVPGCTVPYAIRPTGGRGVLHGHDITIGLALRFDALAQGDPDSSPSIPFPFLPEGRVGASSPRRIRGGPLNRSVRSAYRAGVAPLIEALRVCGIDACLGEEFKGRESGPRSADCFAAISANDVVDRRSLKKVCGVAMLMAEHGVLLQASIPVGPPLVDPSLVYQGPAPVTPVSVDAATFVSALDQAQRNRFCPTSSLDG